MDKFYCTKCFYLTSEDNPPEICPICNSPKEIFDPVVKNEKQFIPEYWNEHIEKKINEIHQRQIQAGANSSSFGLITDLHWAPNEKHSAAILEKVLTDCSVPFFFTGGDIVCGSGVCPASSLDRELNEYTEAFKAIEHKCLMVAGNHDAAYSTLPVPNYYMESLTTDEMYEYYFRASAQYKNRVFGPDGTYCYADDKLHKMRYIALNTHIKWTDEIGENGLPVCDAFRTAGLMQEQLDWFANVALDVPSTDWTVVICTHEPVYTYYPNAAMALGIVDAFRRHKKYEGKNIDEKRPFYNAQISVDFTGRGGNFAVWVGGHTHADAAKYCDGMLSTATLNDSIHNAEGSPYKHVKGTDTEQAFDIFTVDKNAHKIYATRIGCGENREFEYEVF